MWSDPSIKILFCRVRPSRDIKEELYVNKELQEMEIIALFRNRFLTGVHIFPFLIPNGIGVESTFRGMKVSFMSL